MVSSCSEDGFPRAPGSSFTPAEKLHIKAKALQLTDEHVEGLGKTRLHRGLALHESLVDFGSTIHVVRFRREKLLEDVGGPVGFQRPYFHLAEALAAELRLS